MKHLLFLIALAACGGKAAPKPTTTEPASPPPEPVAKAEPTAEPDDPTGALAQAALAEQYDAGKKIYVDKKCATCHGEHGEGSKKSPPVIGANALPEQPPAKSKLRKGITFSTAKDVLDFVKTKMPIKDPGTLSEEDAEAVTSWMLSESKVSIDKPLRASNAASVKLR